MRATDDYDTARSAATAQVSSRGIALGYAAGIIALAGMLVPVSLLGSGSSWSLRCAMAGTGLIWGIGSLRKWRLRAVELRTDCHPCSCLGFTATSARATQGDLARAEERDVARCRGLARARRHAQRVATPTYHLRLPGRLGIFKRSLLNDYVDGYFVWQNNARNVDDGLDRCCVADASGWNGRSSLVSSIATLCAQAFQYEDGRIPGFVLDYRTALGFDRLALGLADLLACCGLWR